jgi:hypothetical protein
MRVERCPQSAGSWPVVALIGMAAVIAAATILGPARASAGVTTRVSVASDGTEGNGGSISAAISADGRFVAFHSFADNLVAGDTNGFTDVFVHDRLTDITERVSVASDGTEGNHQSLVPAISADGRFVAFESFADDLVAGDTNGFTDVFVHDRLTGITERVSVASDGTEGNGASISAAISADGRFVAFQSHADNLVAGDTNGTVDVFVHDRCLRELVIEEGIERIAGLRETVEGMGLSDGIAASLIAQLEAARAALEAGAVDRASHLLRAFVHEARELAGIHLTEEESVELVAEAEAIRSLLACL